MTVFGPAFSRTLRDGCSDLRVYPEWVLQVLAFESGFNPQIKNSIGARGLWQKLPTFRAVVPTGTKPGTKQVLLKRRNDANTGDEWRLYDCYPVDDPAQQLRDAFKFWGALCHQFAIPGFDTREKFYCANLWPAALQGGYATQETRILTTAGAYEANKRALDPPDATGKRRGFITIGSLAAHLDKAMVDHKARYDEEMHALQIVDVPVPVA